MKPSLPPLTTTYKRVFKLYVDSFLYVFPFVLAYVAFESFVSTIMLSKEMSGLNRLFAIILLLLVANAFYCLVIRAVYDRFHQQPTNYLLTMREGLKRYPDFLLSQIILLIPAIIIASLLYFPKMLSLENSTMSPFVSILLNFLQLLGIAGIIAYGLFCLYFYVSPVKIINEKYDAVFGLKESFNLIKGYWIETFVLIFLLALAVILVELLFNQILGPYGTELTRLFTFSLSVCLLIIHCHHLEQVRNAVNLTPEVPDEKIPKP